MEEKPYVGVEGGIRIIDGDEKMVKKVEYDFLDWVSFPSSIKVINNEVRFEPIPILVDYPVAGGETVTLSVMVKGQNIYRSHIALRYFDGTVWKNAHLEYLPQGTYDWREIVTSGKIKSPAVKLRVHAFGGPSDVEGLIATTKVDDAKVWINGELIYETYFTAHRPAKFVPLIIKPPEIIIRAWQHRKSRRT